ncbi:MAG TPA: hypothetical protein VK154_14685 [Chitinophagales bacterium]|nr:hypothetical protein [Chitinophagales bacterium]
MPLIRLPVVSTTGKVPLIEINGTLIKGTNASFLFADWKSACINGLPVHQKKNIPLIRLPVVSTAGKEPLIDYWFLN